MAREFLKGRVRRTLLLFFLVVYSAIPFFLKNMSNQFRLHVVSIVPEVAIIVSTVGAN